MVWDATETAPMYAADNLSEELRAEVAHDAGLTECFVAVIAHDNLPTLTAPPALLLIPIYSVLYKLKGRHQIYQGLSQGTDISRRVQHAIDLQKVSSEI